MDRIIRNIEHLYHWLSYYVWHNKEIAMLIIIAILLILFLLIILWIKSNKRKSKSIKLPIIDSKLSNNSDNAISKEIVKLKSVKEIVEENIDNEVSNNSSSEEGDEIQLEDNSSKREEKETKEKPNIISVKMSDSNPTKEELQEILDEINREQQQEILDEIRRKEYRDIIKEINYTGFSVQDIIKELSSEEFAKEVNYKEIKFEPNDIFIQTTAVKNYPLVNMPSANSRVLLPNHGRIKSKGYTEPIFFKSLIKWFPSNIMTNHYLHFEGAKRNYEPDFIYINREYNLYIDIEIDEPYSGNTRKPMHYINSYDIDRDRYFNTNGWVSIRFTEEQVFNHAEDCCLHIAKVVDSLISKNFKSLFNNNQIIEPTIQWTYEESKQMAIDRYRESYLGITFNVVEPDVTPVETEKSIDSGIIDDDDLVIETRDTPIAHMSMEELEKLTLISKCIEQEQHIRFIYSNGLKHLVRPISIDKNRTIVTLCAYDYIENKELDFEIRLISGLEIEENPFVYNTDYTNVDEISNIMETARNNGLYLRLKYSDAYGKRTLRTIGFFDYTSEFSSFGYINEHISGMCFLRKEKRSFKIERMKHLWVLALSFDNQYE